MLVMLLGFSMGLVASDKDTQAERRAEREHQALERRGWNTDDNDLYEALLRSWTKQLEEDENGVKVYVIGYGNVTAPTLDEAREKALKEAVDHFPGLMMMYFQSWNMAARMEGTLSDEEGEQVRQAVNDSEKAITKAIHALDLQPTLYMHRERRNAMEAHIRVLTRQMELRRIVMGIIAEELVDTHGWDHEDAIRKLTYRK